jgi:transposase
VAIATHLHRHRSWGQKWRRRFAQDRLAGLRDRPRSGRPPRLFPLQQAQIVALACTPPAEAGRAWVRWSVRALHDEIERRQIATLHPSTVHHILTDADLHPHQVRYWRHALAEDFAAKAASVLWYYERAAALVERGELVVCLDEKPNIQALGRTIPDLPPAPGYALRRDWEYVRHGTVNLLVIYNLLTGQLWGRVLAHNDAAHFIPALEAYLAELPWEIRCVHCILDNGSSHIAKATREWVAAQEGLVRLHFTPAHASWPK